MKINVNINESALSLENAEAMHGDAVIKGFFAALSVTEQMTKEVSINVSNPNEKDSKKDVQNSLEIKHTSEQARVSVPVANIVPANEVTPKASKVLPKIDDERTLQVSIGEVVTLENEHWITGIKTDEDGTKRYRTYYWCDCGSKGKRYVKDDEDILKCRECDSELYIEDATPKIVDGLPERDSFGNFFIAREKVEDQ